MPYPPMLNNGTFAQQPVQLPPLGAPGMPQAYPQQGMPMPSSGAPGMPPHPMTQPGTMTPLPPPMPGSQLGTPPPMPMNQLGRYGQDPLAEWALRGGGVNALAQGGMGYVGYHPGYSPLPPYAAAFGPSVPPQPLPQPYGSPLPTGGRTVAPMGMPYGRMLPR